MLAEISPHFMVTLVLAVIAHKLKIIAGVLAQPNSLGVGLRI